MSVVAWLPPELKRRVAEIITSYLRECGLNATFEAVHRHLRWDQESAKWECTNLEFELLPPKDPTKPRIRKAIDYVELSRRIHRFSRN